ncbi:MAG: 2-dehydro-3-deoxyphosphooctonate aldolase [Pseudomonadota bacterium]
MSAGFVRSLAVALGFAGAAALSATAGLEAWAKAETAEIVAAKKDSSKQLKELGLKTGLPVFIRIFKEDSLLEFWMQKDGKWTKYRDFEICKWSGELGPKLREGDGQSPEGFYRVSKGSLNPNSSYYLSFNLGFPNRFDYENERTGTYLMVHGNCVSVGCYAMTDPGIAVIYKLVEQALRNGQRAVPVHIFPFKMTDENLEKHKDSKWISFWRDIRPAYDIFNETGLLPQIKVLRKRYRVIARSPARKKAVRRQSKWQTTDR